MHVTVLTVYRRNPAKAVPAKYQWYGPELFLVHVPIHVMKSKIRFFLGVGPVANRQVSPPWEAGEVGGRKRVHMGLI